MITHTTRRDRNREGYLADPLTMYSIDHIFGETFSMSMFHKLVFGEYNLDLDQMIPTGFSVFSYINKWMVIPLLNSMPNINTGIMILLLTLILKTILFPRLIAQIFQVLLC